MRCLLGSILIHFTDRIRIKLPNAHTQALKSKPETIVLCRQYLPQTLSLQEVKVKKAQVRRSHTKPTQMPYETNLKYN